MIKKILCILSLLAVFGGSYFFIEAKQTTPNNAGLHNENIIEKESTVPSTVAVKKIQKITKQQLPLVKSSDPKLVRQARQRAIYAKLSAMPQRNSFQEHLLNQIINNNRFPPHNQIFNGEGSDPVARAIAPEERYSVSNDGELALTLWSDKKSYQTGEVINIQAYVSAVSNNQKITSVLTGNLIANEVKTLTTLNFIDEDGDGIYSSTINTLDLDGTQLSTGFYKVLVSNNDGDVVDSVAFSLANEHIQLTGKFRDRIYNGDLVVEAEAQILSQGNYYFRASLYGKQPDQNADSAGLSTQQRVQLSVGTHWIALPFDGYMFHQHSQVVQYILRRVSAQKISFPANIGDYLEPNYEINVYSIDDFSDEPYLRLAEK